MTISKSKTYLLCLSFWVLTIRCSEKQYFVEKSINNVIFKSISSIQKQKPSCSYITVYFNSKQGEDFIFITSQIRLSNILSNYYFSDDGTLVVVKFADVKLEQKYVCPEKRKRGKEFNLGTKEIMYENTVFAYRINQHEQLEEVTDLYSSLPELNAVNKVEFLPPVDN